MSDDVSDDADEPYVEMTVTGGSLTFVVANPNFGDTSEDSSWFDLLSSAVGA